MATKRIEKSDLIAPDAISATIEDVKKLNVALTAVLETQKKLLKNNSFKNTADINKYNTAVTTVKSTSKALTAARKEELALNKQLKASTDAEVAGKLRLQQAQKSQKDQLKDLLVLENKESGTLERLAAESRKLRRERQGLNLDTAKGATRLKAINKQLDLNNARIKTNSDALKKQKLSVGAYSAGIQEGIGATGLFSKQLFILQRIQSLISLLTKKQAVETVALAGAQTTAATTTGLLSKALRIFRIALISTGIGAVVVAVGALVAGFLSTQRGADALTRVMIPLKVIFETFIGFIQDTSIKVFDRLKKAIDDPGQAFKDLGEIIVKNITNRFEAILELGGAVGKVLINLAKGNFEKVGEGLEEAANATTKLATGLDDVSGSLRKLAKETADATAKAKKEGDQLAALEINLEKIRIRNTVPLAKQNFLYKQNVALANDQNTSDKDRVKFLTLAQNALGKANDIRKEEIESELKIALLKASFNDTDRDAQLEIQQIKARIFESDTEFQKKSGALVSLRTGIEKKAILSIEKAQIESDKRIKKAQQEEFDRDDRNYLERTRVLEGQLELEKLLLAQSYEDKFKDAEDDAQLRFFLQKELNAKLRKLEDDADAEEKEKRDKRIKENNDFFAADSDKAVKKDQDADKIAEANRKKQIEDVTKSAKIAADALNQISEKKIQNIEEEQKENEKNLTRQERRAEKGLENSLAQEQQRAAQLEKQKEEEAKKQEKRAKTMAYINLLATYAKADADSAVFKASAQIAIAEGVTALFFDGTDRVGDDAAPSPFMTGKDNTIVGVTQEERIFGHNDSLKIRGKLGNITNSDLVELAIGNKNGASVYGFSTAGIEKKLDGVLQAVKESGTSINWDANDNRIEMKIENSIRKKTIYKKGIRL